jgi:hypothetical protein
MPEQEIRIDHNRMKEVVGLARIAGAAHPGGTITTAQYLELAAHYADLQKWLQRATGQPFDSHLVVQYSGPFNRPAKSIVGDASNMRIVVVDDDDKEHELYCGINFDAAEYQTRADEGR